MSRLPLSLPVLAETESGLLYSAAREVAKENPELAALVDRLLANPNPDIPLLYQVLRSSTPLWKMSKPDSNYGPAESQQSCGNCSSGWQNVLDRKLVICSQVSGRIQTADWCRLWNQGRW